MLTLTYLILAVIGCGAVAAALAAGADWLDGGDGAFHFPFFSPTTLAAFAGAVGACGLIAQFGFQVSDSASVAFALPAGVVFTYLVTFIAWRILKGSTGTTTIQADDLAGATAEIITPIPAGGVGEAAAAVRGERFTAPAREVSGLEVPRGAVATVVRYAGSTLYVRADFAGVRRSAEIRPALDQ